MTDRNPSRTALGVAILRAAHQVFDARPFLLDDPVAVALIGAETMGRIESDPGRFQAPEVRALRAHVLLRSRFAEDRLQSAVARGVKQFVVLGAGFDTFAFRQPEWAHSLRVIEVDQPATQGAKRSKLAEAKVAIPDNVYFADIDFEHESLRAGLTRHGVSFDQPTFFSWLGVTMYLTEQAIDDVLRTVADFPAGSEIVFTFAQKARDEHARERTTPSLAERAAELGEPWLSYLEPRVLEAKLRGFGFSAVEFLTPAEASARYFAGRADELPPPKRASIVSATVG